MNDGIINYRVAAATLRAGHGEPGGLPSATAAGLERFVERIGERLADLHCTVELLESAQAAMDSGDIDRMAGVAAALRQRIAARHAALEARRAA